MSSGAAARRLRTVVRRNGRDVAEFPDGEAAIRDPELWWPSGQGTQPLSELSVGLGAERPLVKRIGPRTIVLDRARDRWPDEQDIALRADKVAGRQLVDLLARDRRIEAPIKLIERLEAVGVGDLHSTLDLSLLPDVDLVLQDEGQKLFGCESIGRGFLQPHRQRLAQSGESELMQELMEFVHGSIW